MATGDILAVEIGDEGWFADITIEGLGTGGTYDLGLGANNTPEDGTPKIVFTVTSLGFDATGAATTRTRTVWGTKQVRKAYPNQASNEETVSGTDVIVRVALSDYIYAKDQAGLGNSGTDVSVTVLSGFYTESATPNNGASVTATNSSTAAYQKVVGNWSWPGYELIPAAGLAARCVCFHRHAMNGKPVACVIFEDSEGANTESVTVTAMTIDATMADAVPVPEYIGTPPVTSLTQAAVVTRNFRAYPWIGDDDSVLDTSAGTAAPTPLYGPQKLLCDKTGAFPKTYAKVNPTTGNDAGANTVYAEADYDPTTAYLFQTIGEAASAIAAFNNTTYGRNDVGAAVVELEEGSYAWLGSSNTYGTTPNAWITVRKETAAARANTIISSGLNGSDISDRVKIQNVTITASTLNLFSNVTALWLDQCVINSTGTGMFNAGAGGQTFWITHNTVLQLAQGFKAASTQNVAPALIRGCDLTGFTRSIHCYTVLGNKRTTSYAGAAILLQGEVTGSTAPYPDNAVIAYNTLYGFHLSTFDMVDMGGVGSRNHGLAFVQNILEVSTSNGVPNLMFTAASETVSDNTPQDNFIIWHNTVLGARCGTGYNSQGSVTKYRRFWSWKNNYHDSYGYKGNLFPTEVGSLSRVGTTATATVSGGHFLTTGDTLTIQNATNAAYNGTFVVTVTSTTAFTYTMGSDPGADEASTPASFLSHQGRLGSQPVDYGVGSSGNVDAEISGSGTDGAFPCEVYGLNSIQFDGTTNTANYPAFTNRASFDGTSNGLGDGDYTLLEGSPLIGIPRDWVLPYDIAGNERYESDSAGAYVYGTPPDDGGGEEPVPSTLSTTSLLFRRRTGGRRFVSL